jgi:hypothetical protein
VKTLCGLLLMMVIHACAQAAELFGSVDALSGTAFISDQAGSTQSVQPGQSIYQGQTISSGPDGEVHIVTVDGGIVALRPDTVFRVDQYRAQGDASDKMFMSLLKGAMRSITGWIGKHNNAAYLVTTPTATIGIRGTDHETAVIEPGGTDAPGTYDTVNEGATVLKTAQGEAEVTPGKFAFAPRGRAVAPFFLAHRPHFFALRKLKIEQRIARRKEFLRGRLEQMREQRIRRLKARPAQRRNSLKRELGGQQRNAAERELLRRQREQRQVERQQERTRERFPHRRED